MLLVIIVLILVFFVTSGAACAPAPAMPGDAIATPPPSFTPREWRLLGAAAGVSILSALLVLAGQALFFQTLSRH